MGIGCTEIFLFFATVVGIFVLYAWRRNQYFKNQNVNYLKPYLFVGNLLRVLMGKEHSYDLTLRAIKEYPDDKYVGVFNLMDPIVLIKDLELIKKITIKDFDHFTDHVPFTDEKVDPLFAKILFALKEDRWREMRNALSPAFTSSKMRGMMTFIDECGENMAKYLEIEAEKSANDVVELNLKEFTSKYANDVIASSAFGYKINSFSDKNNEFFKMAHDFVNFTALATFRFIVFIFCPFLLNFILTDKQSERGQNYFRSLVLSSMKEREAKKILRPDMIHLLMLAKKGSLDADEVNSNEANYGVKDNSQKTQWTDDELVAQAIVFLFAGFDTSSTALSAMLQKLAINQDVQAKVHEEIDEFMKGSNGRIEYSDLNKLKYLDMVITETLRLWPPVAVLDRQCVKAYTLPPQNESTGSSLKLKRGDNVWIPAYAIHRNPEYYQDPDEFMPERFSDENKSNLNPTTYMPFGSGPRLCIGQRFALMEIKIAAVHILSKFEVVVTPKTDRQMKIKPHIFDMIPVKGFWAGFKKRSRR